HTPANEVNAHETDPTLENDSTSANDTTTQSNVATTAPQSEPTNESKEHEVFAENIIEISNTELTRDNAIDTLISKLNEHHYISDV
ncbi:PTS mannose transporter subunit IIABC, partial [Staphylococcus epidermidis]